MRPATGRLPQGGGPYLFWVRYLPLAKSHRDVIGVFPEQRVRVRLGGLQVRVQLVSETTCPDIRARAQNARSPRGAGFGGPAGAGRRALGERLADRFVDAVGLE